MFVCWGGGPEHGRNCALKASPSLGRWGRGEGGEVGWRREASCEPADKAIRISEVNTLNKPFDDNKHGYLPVFRITAIRKHTKKIPHFHKHVFIWRFWICIL